MSTRFVSNGGSNFHIRRPLATANGIAAKVEPAVETHLLELQKLLGKRCFDPGMAGGYAAGKGPSAAKAAATTPPTTAAAKAAWPPNWWRSAAAASVPAATPVGPSGGTGGRPATDVVRRLDRPLTPKRVATPSWAVNSLAAEFANAQEKPSFRTLAEVIGGTPGLLELRYAVNDALEANWFPLDANAKVVLDDGYPAIRDYLVAYAYHVRGLRGVEAVRNFLVEDGVGWIADYAAVSAARTIVDEEKLVVANIDDDNGAIVQQITAAGLPLSEAVFRPRLDTVVDNFVFNSDELDFIDQAGLGVIPPGIRPQLVEFIKKSPVPIDNNNIKFFLPMFITQASGGLDAVDVAASPADADLDFAVRHFEDDDAQLLVSQSAVKCAAQLYFTLVLGHELAVFDVVDFFTRKYLLRDGFAIVDPNLRRDLQIYVFSDKFTAVDGRTGTKQVLDRTRAAERGMFYRQVFNYGGAPIADDMLVNADFPALWDTLIIESGNYLTRAQASPHPDNFVSRQNVMQAVEDLQYNLSAHCTGMATVASPLILKELEFVIDRILSHPEVVRNVVPTGGSWLKVVEKLSAGMRNVRPRAGVINNKAKFGDLIIRTIASYDPATFEADPAFSNFISLVDAFISTQSILQEQHREALERAGEDPAIRSNGGYRANGTAPAMTPSDSPVDDEWQF